MKNIKIFYLLVVMSLMILGCDKEDDFNPQKTESKYQITDSDNALEHAKYMFYKNYGIVVIDKVGVEDYVYTGGVKLSVVMGESLLDDDQKVELLNRIDKNFYSKTPKLSLESAPFKLILADSITLNQVVVEWVYNPETGRMEEVSSLQDVHQKFYLNANMLAIPTEEGIFDETDDGRFAWFDDQRGPQFLGEVLLDKMVVENILIKRYGDRDWQQHFYPLYGDLKNIVGDNSAFNFDWNDETYENAEDWGIPLEMLDKLIFRQSDIPGGAGPELDEEAIMGFLYDNGFPAYSELRNSSRGVRLKMGLQQIVPGWIIFASLPNRDQIFEKHPNMKVAYFKAKKLIKEYTDIEIE